MVWFYCENCFNTSAVNLDDLQTVAESMTEFAWNNDGMFCNLSGYICPKCGCPHSTFQVDQYMVPVVSMLNNHGYITHACCSGHTDSNCFHSKSDEAYIYLYHSSTLEKYLSEHNLCTSEGILSVVNFSVEIGDGKNNTCDGIIIRAKFKEEVSEEDKIEWGLHYLAYAIFSCVIYFPENTDELKLQKYTYLRDDGTPYTDKKEE